MSLRIRTRSGEVIDLADVRRSAQSRLTGMALLGEREPAVGINLILLDALEAVLSVPEKPQVTHQEKHFNPYLTAYNHARKDFRQAAGVIEPPIHPNGCPCKECHWDDAAGLIEEGAP